jgi:putative two-component system response regulator
LGQDYTVMTVSSGEEALRMAPAFRPNLVLLDVMMPGMDGLQTCRRLRAMPDVSRAKIVMLSARSKLNDRLAAYDMGAVDYIAKPFDHYEVTAKVRAWMQMVGKEEIASIWRDMETAQLTVGAAMLNLASFRDSETGEHLFRVRWYAQTLAEELSSAGPYRILIDRAFKEDLYRASPLHDVGKIGVDDAILRKPGPLTEQEFASMKKHTIVGFEILRAAARKLPAAGYLTMAAEVARHHHEWFDGSGYPDGLAGAKIPLAARILAVADVFDALTTQRVYKDAISVSAATEVIQRETRSHFDPVVMGAFEAQLDAFRLAQTRFAAQCAMYDGSLMPAEALFDDCPVDPHSSTFSLRQTETWNAESDLAFLSNAQGEL